MSRRMPSPRGTNHAGLYLGGAAYDAVTGLNVKALDDGTDPAAELLDFLADKLSPEDMASVTKMVRGDDDEPDAASDAAIMARRRAAHSRGELSYDAMRAPIVRPTPPMDAKQFPHANRLK